jgi:hypothetical protein
VDTTVKKFAVAPVSFQSESMGEFSPSPAFSFGLKKINDKDRDLVQSDFYLDKNLSHITGGKKPLVLSSTMTLAGQYVNGIAWNKDDIINFKQPYHSDLNERTLPKTTIGKYPFIIDSDLFQPGLVSVSYNINDNFFHTIKSSKFGTRFLLPVKPLFFEIIGLDSGNIEDYIQVSDNGPSITLTISIPIVGTDPRFQEKRQVKFIREYVVQDQKGSAQINTDFDSPFEMAFFPFFRRTDDPSKNNHRKIILWMERTNAETRVANILFYDNRFDIIGTDKVYNSYTHKGNDAARSHLPGSFPLQPHTRMSYDNVNLQTKYFTTTADYRIIEIKLDNGIGGLLVPKFIEKKGPFNKKYKYAIDFGTTSTHIEYAELNHQGLVESTKSAFKIKAAADVPDRLTDLPLVVLMHKSSASLGDLDKVYPILMREFMPASVGNDQNAYDIKFPTRTVMLDFIEPTGEDDAAFLNSNIAFKMGEKDDFHPQAVYTPDLKWLLGRASSVNELAYKNRIRIFFEQLFYMIKYKSLMDDGDESGLVIGFTRPMSMKGTTLNQKIQTEIKKAIRKVFPGSNADDTNRYIFELDESLAPFESDPNQYSSPSFANIDIGGGTTDILFGYQDTAASKVSYKFYLSSVRFAGNDLWGNEVNPADHNGLIKYYIDIANRKAEKLNEDHPYKLTYKQFLQYCGKDLMDPKYMTVPYNKGLSDAELVSVLFKNDKVLQFTESVFGDCKDFKLLPFIHYTAILYFVSHVYNKYKEKLTTHTTFSMTGNGSLYLKLLKAPSIAKLMLKQFSNGELILDNFITVENPKEITARGALYMDKALEETVASAGGLDEYEETEKICQEITPHIIDISSPDKLRKELVDAMETFFDLLKKTVQEKETLKNDIGDITKYEEILNKASYGKYVQNWLNKERPDLAQLEDSVFFKPLKYILFDLSNAIYAKNKIK